jgi:hypothetical protein
MLTQKKNRFKMAVERKNLFMKPQEIDFSTNKRLVIEAIRNGRKFLAGWSALPTFSTSPSPNKEAQLALMRHLKTGLMIKVEWGFEIPNASARHTGWKVSIKAPVFGRPPQVVYYCFEALVPSELQLALADEPHHVLSSGDVAKPLRPN